MIRNPYSNRNIKTDKLTYKSLLHKEIKQTNDKVTPTIKQNHIKNCALQSTLYNNELIKLGIRNADLVNLLNKIIDYKSIGKHIDINNEIKQILDYKHRFKSRTNKKRIKIIDNDISIPLLNRELSHLNITDISDTE